MTAEAYLQILLDPGSHWSWGCLEHFLLRPDRMGLLVGISLTDPSLRLLLGRWARQGHAAYAAYIAPPVPALPASARNRELHEARALARRLRALADLHDRLIRSLGLVPVRLPAWSRVSPFLREIER